MQINLSLNCVWIQAVRLGIPEKEDLITCPIPEDFIKNIEDIAARFPDLPVNIWVDIYGVGNNAERLMCSLNQIPTQPNICFKALDGMADYKTNSLFEKPSEDIRYAYDPIW